MLHKITNTTLFIGLSVLFSCFPTSEQQEKFPELPNLQKQEEQPNTQATAKPKRVSIALTGEIRGEIEPCGCPTLPYGGYVRQANLIRKLQEQNTALFQMDAGEMLLKGFFSNKGEQKTERAELIITLAQEIGLDVWAVGPSDVMAIDINTLQKIDDIALISATWQDKNGAWLFPPFTVLEKENVRIAVIGLSEEPTDPGFREQIVYRKPIEAVQEILPKIPTDIDLLIGLGSIDDFSAEEIAQNIPEIAMLLTTEGSHHQQPFYPYSNPQNALIIETPKQGRFVEHIQLIIGGKPDQAPEMLLSEQDWRSWLLFQSQGESEKKNELQKRFDAKAQNKNLYYVEQIPLSKTYDSPNDISKYIDNFATETIKKAQTIAKQETTTIEPGFASSGACAQCHTKELARWAFSKHSRAWETLIREEQTMNPECVTCHTTGFAQKGGFGELNHKNIRKFKAVQCEACHGPMRGHPNDLNVHSQPIGKETCLPCHDEANSPNFDWERYLSLATCQED